MKRTTLHGVYSVLLVTWAVFAYNTLAVNSQSAADTATIGTVHLTQAVLADGKPLAAATYQVRLTSDQPTAAVGQSAGAERWVEFVKDGKVAGREIATVVAAPDIGAIAKGPQPAANGSRVDVLKGGDYLRVWINKAGTNYIVNMPLAR
jgi:hypothetical protein